MYYTVVHALKPLPYPDAERLVVVAALGVAAILAVLRPAGRAAGIDPISSIRAET
jgi:hypothetical protein